MLMAWVQKVVEHLLPLPWRRSRLLQKGQSSLAAHNTCLEMLETTDCCDPAKVTISTCLFEVRMENKRAQELARGVSKWYGSEVRRRSPRRSCAKPPFAQTGRSCRALAVLRTERVANASCQCERAITSVFADCTIKGPFTTHV